MRNPIDHRALDARSDIEKLREMGKELERRGTMDADAKGRLETQLQSISTRLDKEIEERLAELRGERRPPVGLLQKVAAAILLFGLVSIPLEFTVGEYFIFSYSSAHSSATPVLLSITLPLCATFLFFAERQQRHVAYRYPTTAVRWLMYPLIVVLMSFAVVYAPFGWSALAGWAFGDRHETKEAKVISVEPLRPKGGKCDQSAVLRIDATRVKICLEHKVAGRAPKAGDSIVIEGRGSFLGLFIEKISVK